MAYRKSEPGVVHRLLRSRIAQILLLILIGLLSTQVLDQYQSAKMTQERRQQSETDFYQREAERQQLADQVGALHDSYVIESEIRRHFDVAKAGEDVIIILDPPPDESLEQEAQVDEEEALQPWFRFW